MQLSEHSTEYIPPELALDAVSTRPEQLAEVSVQDVLQRIMRPPSIVLKTSLWLIGLIMVVTGVALAIESVSLGRWFSEEVFFVVASLSAAALLWYVMALTITGARLSQVTNIEGQANAVCGHEILLTPITDNEVLSALLRSHFPSVYAATLLTAFALLGARSSLSTMLHGAGVLGVVENAMVVLPVLACTTIPLAALIWCLLSLLVLRRVSQRMKPVWMTALVALLTGCGVIYVMNPPYDYYYQYDGKAVLIGVATCLALLYLAIRFLGLPKRRVRYAIEVWLAFVLTSVAGVLWLLGTVMAGPVDPTWLNIPVIANLTLSPWNPYIFEWGDAAHLNWELLFWVLLAQGVWVALLWPMALGVIRESRAPQ